MAVPEKKSSDKEAGKTPLTFMEKLYTLSGDMICVAGFDTCFKRVNPAFEKCLGYSPEELLDKSFLDFIHPDDLDATKRVVSEKLAEGVPVFNFENRYRCKNGTWKWLSWTSNPVVAEQLTYAIARDITEHKSAEQKVRESEKRYQQLFDMESDAIFLIDVESGRFIEANKAASDLYGYTHGELLEKRNVDLSAEPEATLAVMANNVRKVPLRFHKKKDGTVFPVEITLNRFVHEGRPAVICAVRDVSENLKTKNALEKSELKYHSLFSAMQNGFSLNEIICDDKGNPEDYVTLEVNSAFETLLGQPAAVVLNQRASQFLPKAELYHWLGIFGPVAMTGKSASYEMYSPLNDKYFEGITYSPEQGKFAVVFRDVTEQKMAEHALRELATKDAHAAHQWQETFDCADDIICLISRDFEMLRINKKGLDAIGKPMEEVIGKKCYELVHRTREPVKNCPCVTTLQTGAAGTGEVRERGMYFRTSASPIRNEQGEVTAFVHTISNITPEKNSQLELQEAHRDLEIAQRLTKIGSWKWNMAANKVTWSKGLCDILGWDYSKPPPPFGEEMAVFYNRESWQKLNEVVGKALTTGEPYDVETTEITTGGKTIITNTRGEVDRGPDGKIIGLHGTVQDITERKQMQEQLFVQDRLASIGQLVSGVAHELNNPLQSVIGFSELLLQSELPKEVAEDVKIINSEAQRTSKIVKNLLVFARQQPEEKRPVDISQPIRTVLNIREHEQSVSNIHVNTQFAENLPEVMGNTSQLQQVFFNIVINAEFAMLESHRSGTLTIKTERQGDYVEVSLSDDGPGIPPENMSRLFSPFFTTKEVGQGTGLGLSICQGIVTEHGGSLRAENNPGGGATFIVKLPVYEPKQGKKIGSKKLGSPT